MARSYALARSSPGRRSHSNPASYIPFVILRTEYTQCRCCAGPASPGPGGAPAVAAGSAAVSVRNAAVSALLLPSARATCVSSSTRPAVPSCLIPATTVASQLGAASGRTGGENANRCCGASFGAGGANAKHHRPIGAPVLAVPRPGGV